MKILLIGVGKWGENHLRVLSELNQDLYVADINKEETVKKCKAFNIPESRISTDYHDFLNQVDAVDIVTPTNLHYKISKECINLGKDVFVEKPFTTSIEEAKGIVQLVKNKNKIIMVGHIFVFNPVIKFIKKCIKSGSLGKIYYLFGSFSGLKNIRSNLGTTLNYATHHISVLNYLFGNPTEVRGFTANFLRKEYEDLTLVILKYGDIVAYFDCSWLPPGKVRNLTVVGSKASIIADLLNQKVRIDNSRIVNGKVKRGTVEKPFTDEERIKWEEPLKVELEHFIDSVNKRIQPITDGKHAIGVMGCLEKILKSG